MDAIDCYATLENIESNYGIEVGASTINNVIFHNNPNVCAFYDNMLEEVFYSFYEEIALITPKNSTSGPYSSFFNRTLECESFNFVQQNDGDAWIACVDGLYFSKNYAGAYASTDEYCLHFTLPRIRHTGEMISLGRAQDCAAWAANAAAVDVGRIFAERTLMTDEGVFLLFRTKFKIRAAITNCGYGVAVNCNAADCMGTTTDVIWTDGFFDWLDEIFFGCE